MRIMRSFIIFFSSSFFFFFYLPIPLDLTIIPLPSSLRCTIFTYELGPLLEPHSDDIKAQPNSLALSPLPFLLSYYCNLTLQIKEVQEPYLELLIQRYFSSKTPFISLLRNIALMLHSCSGLIVHHIFREANSTADWTASFVAFHSRRFICFFLLNIHVQFKNILSTDSLDCTSFKIIFNIKKYSSTAIPYYYLDGHIPPFFSFFFKKK